MISAAMAVLCFQRYCNFADCVPLHPVDGFDHNSTPASSIILFALLCYHPSKPRTAFHSSVFLTPSIVMFIFPSVPRFAQMVSLLTVFSEGVLHVSVHFLHRVRNTPQMLHLSYSSNGAKENLVQPFLDQLGDTRRDLAWKQLGGNRCALTVTKQESLVLSSKNKEKQTTKNKKTRSSIQSLLMDVLQSPDKEKLVPLVKTVRKSAK